MAARTSRAAFPAFALFLTLELRMCPGSAERKELISSFPYRHFRQSLAPGVPSGLPLSTWLVLLPFPSTAE